MFSRLPRMLVWFVASAILFIASASAQHLLPSTLLAVSLYKAHIVVAAGWLGYILDRALFPYARPHEQLPDAIDGGFQVPDPAGGDGLVEGTLVGPAFSPEWCMLRRAIIVAACEIAVAIGA